MDSIFSRKIELLQKQIEQNSTIPRMLVAEEVPEIMDLNALVKYLGNVSAGTVYQWMHRNLIPNFKVGKRVYFRRADIDAWLESKKR